MTSDAGGLLPGRTARARALQLRAAISLARASATRDRRLPAATFLPNLLWRWNCSIDDVPEDCRLLSAVRNTCTILAKHRGNYIGA